MDEDEVSGLALLQGTGQVGQTNSRTLNDEENVGEHKTS